jgi:hypothetical protein
MMTGSAALLPTAVSRPRRRAPWPVIAAFYLWWLLIVAQSIGLVWIGFTFDQAARIGGPAWDILFVYLPIGLPTLVLVVSEIALVLRLRQASRAARIWLLVFAIPAAASVVFIVLEMWSSAEFAAASVGFVSPVRPNPVGVWSMVAVTFVIAIAAGVLPFLPPVGRFFRKRRRVPPGMPVGPRQPGTGSPA